MKQSINYVMFIAVALLFAGCGRDKVEVQADSATQAAAVDAARGLAVMPSGDNLSVEEAMLPLSNAFGTAGAVSAAGSTQLGISGMPAVTTTDACLQASPGHLTFTNCNGVSGQITYGNGSFAANLTANVNSNGTQLTFSGHANLNISPAHVSGSLHVDLSLTENSVSVTATVDASFDIGYTDGCPTSGSINVDAHAQGNGQSATASMEADFGPACGDVKFFTFK